MTSICNHYHNITSCKSTLHTLHATSSIFSLVIIHGVTGKAQAHIQHIKVGTETQSRAASKVVDHLWIKANTLHEFLGMNKPRMPPKRNMVLPTDGREWISRSLVHL
jgi:hypothetical protein